MPFWLCLYRRGFRTTRFGARFHTRGRARIREAFSKSLEELVEMEVTSVTGIEHEWIETPAAAVHVITGEDIRRSGHRHLAEILRMAPGMKVGRIDSWHWAVTARTFNDVWVGKQLVLVDGREIYGQWFSGVFWEFEDLPIDLIDKIEIIRGPGACVWGINAMNGVINIKTKKSADIGWYNRYRWVWYGWPWFGRVCSCWRTRYWR